LSKGMFNRKKLSSEVFQLTVEDTELFLGDELKGTLRVVSGVEFDIEKIWINLRCEESLEKAKSVLYEDNEEVTDAIHVNVGFDREFPFTIKLPFIGRETFDSLTHNVQWLVYAYIKVKGIKKPISAEGGGFILVAKPKESTKEIVREIVLIPCSYCGGLMPQSSIFCPNCGARRKAS